MYFLLEKFVTIFVERVHEPEPIVKDTFVPKPFVNMSKSFPRELFILEYVPVPPELNVHSSNN